MQYAAVKRVGHKKICGVDHCNIIDLTAASIGHCVTKHILVFNTSNDIVPVTVGQYFDKTQKFPIELISKLPFKIPIPIYRGCGLSELLLNMLWLG